MVARSRFLVLLVLLTDLLQIFTASPVLRTTPALLAALSLHLTADSPSATASLSVTRPVTAQQSSTAVAQGQQPQYQPSRHHVSLAIGLILLCKPPLALTGPAVRGSTWHREVM
jgi:hypothetical protein